MKELIKNYKPSCMQEEKDKDFFIKYLNTFDDVLTRENIFGHATSSAFIVNKKHTKVLMAYHNIYKSFAWLGGHMDGEANPLAVSIREAEEESGIKNLKLLHEDIISLDVIQVEGHFKKGVWVTPHVHLNVTYLFEADDKQFIKNKDDENSAVAWLDIDNLENVVLEKHMIVIYKKIIDKLNQLEVIE